jgi:glycosyltransferase involved in cell wall biosynthesis
MSPRVSVLMPVYNGARYLDAAVQSILCQTYADFELVVVDDGSTDESLVRIAAYRDPRIRVVRSGNRGVGAALALAVEHARGEYLARMDADDISAPHRLQLQVACLDAHPDVGVVDAASHQMDRSGRPLADEEEPAPPARAARRWKLLWRNVITHPTVMMRAAVLSRASATYRAGCVSEDYDLWLRLLPHTEFLRLPERLLWYRRHSESITAAWDGRHFACLAELIAASLSMLTARPVSEGLGADLSFLTRQTYQRPEEYECRATSTELVELVADAFRAFQLRFPISQPELAAIRAETAEQLLDWAWLLDRCRRGPPDGTRRLALAALSYHPAAVFSGRFARHLLASAIGSRGLGHLRRALKD